LRDRREKYSMRVGPAHNGQIQCASIGTEQAAGPIWLELARSPLRPVAMRGQLHARIGTPLWPSVGISDRKRSTVLRA
jgi:hypothetical protein